MMTNSSRLAAYRYSADGRGFDQLRVIGIENAGTGLGLAAREYLKRVRSAKNGSFSSRRDCRQ